MYNGNINSFVSTNDSNNTTMPNNAFMRFGDNDSSLEITRCLNSNYIAAINRVWKVHITPAFAGNATLKVNASLLPPNIKNLIVSTTPNFAVSTYTLVPLQTNATALFANYNFANNTYFTFATDSVKINLQLTASLCFAANGKAVATVSNGASPYTYNWNGTATSSPSFSGIASGNYTVDISHGLNCTVSIPYTIKDSVFLKISATTQNILCFDSANGQIQINTLQGAPPISYTLQNNGTVTNTGLFTHLSANTYTVEIKDNNGCIVDTILTLTTAPAINWLITNLPSCWNASTGTITNTVSGGTAPYLFNINAVGYSTASQFNNLYTGTYTVQLKDNNACTYTQNTTIVLYDSFMVRSTLTPATCDNQMGAGIELDVYGKYAPYTYHWLTYNSTSNAIQNIKVDSYPIVITDINGCSSNYVFTTVDSCCRALFGNAFSPNNDHVNDTFLPLFSSAINAFQLQIYNRYGMMVFGTSDKNLGWNGTYNGKPCDEGTYFYIFSANCNQKNIYQNGDVILVR